MTPRARLCLTARDPTAPLPLQSPNLLVDEHWRCAVTDFNLATVVQEGSTAQSTGIPINPRCAWRQGCMRLTQRWLADPRQRPLASCSSSHLPVAPPAACSWLAPEILKGARASAASDVFAFACVLWEVGGGARGYLAGSCCPHRAADMTR